MAVTATNGHNGSESLMAEENMSNLTMVNEKPLTLQKTRSYKDSDRETMYSNSKQAP